VSGASGINSIADPEGTTTVPSVESSVDDSSKPQIYSEDEGLDEIRKLLVCQDEDIKFLRKEMILNEYLYEYESDETNYLFDPNRGVLVGIINLEYNMSGSDISDDSSISKAEEYVSEYFPDLDLSKMELTVNELIDHGSFQDRNIEFRKLIAGVDTGNSIMIRLTPGGDLISIMLWCNDELALQQAVNFDAEKAVEIAYAKVKEDMVANGREAYVKDAADYEYEIRKTVFRDNLVWLIKVNGVSLFGSGDDANSDSAYTVIISCESGAVVLFDSTF
jgi:hypothetical protein